MRRHGIIDMVSDMLSDFEVTVYDRVESNPGFETIDDGVNEAGDSGVVIGLGGGSAIDSAKCISIIKTNGGGISSYLSGGRNIMKEGLPVLAIPTTAGTGSEVTKWATVWDKKNRKKHSLSSELMYPRLALLDPDLTLTMPRFLTASTGLDALTHAIEAYWSVNSFPKIDGYALSSVRLINGFLEKACNDLEDIVFREKILYASLLAGKAFSQTSTSIVHSVSYPLTAYFNVSHGLACGLTLPLFMEYNYNVGTGDCADRRGIKFVKKRMKDIAGALGCTRVADASSRIRELMSNCGLPTTLKGAGVTNLEVIVREGFTKDRVKNNPRELTRDGLRVLLASIV